VGWSNTLQYLRRSPCQGNSRRTCQEKSYSCPTEGAYKVGGKTIFPATGSPTPRVSTKPPPTPRASTKPPPGNRTRPRGPQNAPSEHRRKGKRRGPQRERARDKLPAQRRGEEWVRQPSKAPGRADLVPPDQNQELSSRTAGSRMGPLGGTSKGETPRIPRGASLQGRLRREPMLIKCACLCVCVRACACVSM
jgi:hypothetical protein